MPRAKSKNNTGKGQKNSAGKTHPDKVKKKASKQSGKSKTSKKFNHLKYDLKQERWKNKQFYRVKMPFFSKKADKILERINKAFDEIVEKGYSFDKDEHMILHEENKPFRKGEILIEIENADPSDRKVKSFDDRHIFSKSHVGHIDNVHRSLKKLGIHVDKKKKKIKDTYYWYVSIPDKPKNMKDYKTIIFVVVDDK